MSNAPCWVERMDIDPLYDYRSDSFSYDAPLWAPNCGHQACVEDEAIHARGDECEDWTRCPQIDCHWNTAHAMCDLDKGHPGEHEFAAPGEIVLEFPAAPSPSSPRAARGA